MRSSSSSESTPRLPRRTRNRAPSGPRVLRAIVFTSLRLGILAVLAVSLTMAFSAYLETSPGFEIERIEIRGTFVLAEDDVLEVMGVSLGESLWAVDPAAVSARVAALPEVAHCRIVRAMPDTLLVHVTERPAVALLLVDNHAFELDRDARVLREVNPLATFDGPIITAAPNLGYVDLGQTVPDLAVQEALAFWEAFQTSRFKEQWTVSEIAAVAANEIITYFEELPFEIRWGRSDYRQQLAYAAVLWDSQNGPPPCLEYLDLRFDNELVCK